MEVDRQGEKEKPVANELEGKRRAVASQRAEEAREAGRTQGTPEATAGGREEDGRSRREHRGRSR